MLKLNHAGFAFLFSDLLFVNLNIAEILLKMLHNHQL
jgi:hypothetical protein